MIRETLEIVEPRPNRSKCGMHGEIGTGIKNLEERCIICVVGFLLIVKLQVGDQPDVIIKVGSIIITSHTCQ